MLTLSRKACSVLIAVAVLLVSMTCSSAGCLLTASIHSKTVALCCCQQHNDSSKPHNGEKQCPLCKSNAAIARTADKNPALQDVAGLSDGFAPISVTIVPTIAILRYEIPVDLAADYPPTLFALHCSLLI